jgi:hypothetical protein
MMFRRAAAVALAFTLLTGCGQEGTPQSATEAADHFLSALAKSQHDVAWSHLSPATREVLWDDDPAAFAEEVLAADWASVTWEFGPVVDHDISWGVHVRMNADARREFLVARRLAAELTDGIVLLVQTPDGDPYLIAGQSLDTRL